MAGGGYKNKMTKVKWIKKLRNGRERTPKTVKKEKNRGKTWWGINMPFWGEG